MYHFFMNDKGYLVGKQFQLVGTNGRMIHGKVLGFDDTHVTIQRLRRASGDNEPPEPMIIPHSAIASSTNMSPPEKESNRRSNEDRDNHRSELLGQIGEQWARTPDKAHRSDVDHLIKTGQVESEVRIEFDAQEGNRFPGAMSSMFAGSGKVKRQRRYLRKTSPQ